MKQILRTNKRVSELEKMLNDPESDIWKSFRNIEQAIQNERERLDKVENEWNRFKTNTLDEETQEYIELEAKA